MGDDSLVDGWNSGLVDGRSDTAGAAEIGCAGLVGGWGGPAGAAGVGELLGRHDKGAAGMGVEAGPGRNSSVGSVPPVMLDLILVEVGSETGVGSESGKIEGRARRAKRLFNRCLDIRSRLGILFTI